MIMNEDHIYLKQALELAKIRRGFCFPNPSVGAVIVRDGEVLSTGFHFAAGCDHAEVDALKKISQRGENTTAYVTLEPCCHFGRTPPCTTALIQAGVKRVVYGFRDPNPLVGGKGEKILKENNIVCDYISLTEISDFYESYQYWQQRKLPFITAKIAVSLDGKSAGKNNTRLPLTGDALQKWTHDKRKKSDAILTTSKTVIADDPLLNVRYPDETIAKPIYVLDSQLNFPSTAKLLKTAKTITLFHAKNASEERYKRLTDLGVRCIAVDENSQGLDLHAIVKMIGKDGVQDLWVEAGGRCFSAFVQENLVQVALIYIAPMVIGEGVSAFHSDWDARQQKIQWIAVEQDAVCKIRL